MAWTAQEDAKLLRLAEKQTMFFADMAKELGKPVEQVRWRAKKLGIPSTRKTMQGLFGKWNAKHAHLREPAMRYFMTHSFEETMEKFKLTKSELKSLQTVSYGDPLLSHLRKDTRNHAPWSTRELKFLLQHAGLKPREWIARKLKRGNAVCVKERLQTLGVSSRSLNGITLTQFISAFGRRPDFCLQTKAGPGPGRGGTPTYYKIIPWVYLEQELKSRRLKTAKSFRQLVRSMALFQEWVFEGDALEKMKRIVGQR